MIQLDDRLLLAIPKKGRLFENAVSYLKRIGLQFHKPDRYDIALCSATPLALIFLPAHDIPLYVANGRVSFGITGQDMILENNVESEIDELLSLGFGKCKLCLAAPKSSGLKPENLSGKRIATSFPHLTTQYFKNKYNINNIQIKEITGSVEITPTLGISEAVVDLVETGSTLIQAGLEVIDVIIQTEAVLLAKKNLSPFETDWKERLMTRFDGILTAEKHLMIDYNISKKYLKEAEKITPGMNSPTVMSLEQEGWAAVRSVISKNELYAVIENLKKIGAQAILVSKMEYFQL
ncbi:MAG TPA: ATP phosphoribosyltransferase [Spirochaetia bacterium]|nr:MAG: ATP phosphoribosyltransferase [Spirochaetes bacterium GWB1_36_13]HCL57150.1 ATP phosphoribosyltransferase [Spirochaetia bacterium]